MIPIAAHLAVTVAVLGAQTAVEVLGELEVVLGLAVPVLVALAVRSTAPARAKQWVTIGIVAAVGALSLATEDWSMITAELVAARLLALAGQAQVTYVAASTLVARLSDRDGLNDLGVFAPDRGIGRDPYME